MVDERPPWLIRPIHGWFHWWEDIVLPAYRVAAVASAAVATAALAVLLLNAHWLVALVAATAAWILLAVIQEHDERVVLDVDGEFLMLLRDRVDAVVDPAGFVFRSASGPTRARRERYDTFLYEVLATAETDCIDLWIRRDRASGGQLQLDMDGIRHQIARSKNASVDVDALVAALEDTLPAGGFPIP